MSLNLKVKKLDNFADFKPRDFGNAGFDLYASEEGILLGGQRAAISVGISTSFNPDLITDAGHAIKFPSGVLLIALIASPTYA